MTDLMPRPVTDNDCLDWQGERLVLGTNADGIGKPGLEVVVTTSIDEATEQEVPHVCVPFCLVGTSTVPLFVTTEPDYFDADR